MTPSTFETFLASVMWVCAALALLNLALVKRRGTSAYLMSAAFLVMGGTVYLYREGFATGWLYFGGVVLALLLGADLVLRAPNQQERRKR